MNTIMKYLFTAEYKDGSSFKQDANDRSLLDPEKRSAFYDALEHEKEHGEMTKFHLDGEGHAYSVDLEQQLFSIDRTPFRMHTMPLADIRLVYFRRHTHTYRPSDMEETDHSMTFNIGYQGIDEEGKNVERIMTID